jgi:hypothetical protein
MTSIVTAGLWFKPEALFHLKMIPKKLHFVYISTPAKGGLPFYFCYWVAIRSAMRLNPEYEVNLWYEEEPKSRYFDALRGMVRLRKVTPPDHVFGNPVPHYAHKADVLRLQILLEEGGVYLDLDTVTVRPFDALLNNTVVMSIVKNSGRIFGLGNSVIMSSPSSSFLHRWYESYRTFRSRGHDEFYDEHGAGYSFRLAKQFPLEITLLDEKAFLTPDMTPRGIADLFLVNGNYPHAFCHHLWGKNAQDVIESLSEWNVYFYPGLYSRQVTTIIPQEVQRLRDTAAGCSPSSLVPVIPQHAVVHVSALHEIQKRFSDAVADAKGHFAGDGIVTVTQDTHVSLTWLLLMELSRLDIDLPVEVWTAQHELSQENQALLAAAYPRVRFRVLQESIGPAALKPYAICYSSFSRVLWLNCDCFPLRDPRQLFEDPEFQTKGSLFWLDGGDAIRANTSVPTSDEWSLYGVPYNDCGTLSTSQFIINKEQCLPQLLFSMFLNRNSHLYQPVYGNEQAERNSFKFAWQYFQYRRNGALPATGYLEAHATRAFGYMVFAPHHIRPAQDTAGSRQPKTVFLHLDRDGCPLFVQGAVELDSSALTAFVEPLAQICDVYTEHLSRLQSIVDDES